MTAHEDRWRSECPGCGVDDFHVVVSEGRRRMTVKCQDCLHSWVLCSPGGEYVTGYRARNAVEFDVAAARVEYEAGDTLAVVAARHAVAVDTLRKRLIAAGVVMRSRRASLVPGGGCAERAAATRRRARGLRGRVSQREAASILGVSPKTIWRAWRVEA